MRARAQWRTLLLASSIFVASASAHAQTIPPNFFLPPSNTSLSFPPVSYQLPEAPLPGSVRLTLHQGPSSIFVVLADALNPFFLLNTVNLLDSPLVLNSSQPFVPDGTYDFELSYRDEGGSPPANAFIPNVIINKAADTTTSPPSLFQPIGNTTYSSVPVAYQLAEPALPGSAQLSFHTPFSNISIILSLTNSPVASFTVDPDDPAGTPQVLSSSSSTIPDGLYDVELLYQDALGNPPSSEVVEGVRVLRATGDTTTQPPTVLLPIMNMTYGILPVAYLLPETAAPGTVELHFAAPFLNSSIILLLSGTESNAFDLNPNDLRQNIVVTNASSSYLPNGNYTVTLLYQDALLNPHGNMSVPWVGIDRGSDTSTTPPVLSSPTCPSATNAPHLVYALPEMPLPGNISFSFIGIIGNYSNILYLTDARTADFVLSPSNLLSSPLVVSASGATLPDGTYDVQLSYRDALGNPPASSGCGPIVIDTTTQAPSMGLPLYNISYPLVPVQYELPEPPDAGSVELRFDPLGNCSSVVLLLADSTIASFVIDPDDPAAGPLVLNSSIPFIADCTYDVTLSYQDALRNPIGNFTVPFVTVDRGAPPDSATQAPTLAQPIGNLSYSTVPVLYLLPEYPLPGSVHLEWVPFSNATILMQLGDGASSNFLLDPRSVLSSPEVLSSSSSTLPDDTYTVTLSYQDVFSNAAASSTQTDVRIDTTTQPPVLTSPASSTSHGSTLPVSYTLAEAPASGSVELRLSGPLINISLLMFDGSSAGFSMNVHDPAAAPEVVSSSSSSIPDGLYSVQVVYQDELGNAAASDTSTNVRVDAFCAEQASTCDNGVFCDGAEGCSTGACTAGSSPCVPGQVCNEATDSCEMGCPAIPSTGCLDAGKMNFQYANGDDPAKRKLVWLWGRGSQLDFSQLGNPVTSTDFALCGYAGPLQAPLFSLVVPQDSDLWKTIGTDKGFSYSDSDSTQDGVKGVKIKAGADGKSLGKLVGLGPLLPVLTLPFSETTGLPLVVQLINSDNGTCLATLNVVGDVLKNSDTKFKASHTTP